MHTVQVFHFVITLAKEMQIGHVMSHLGGNTKQNHFLLSLNGKSWQQLRLKDKQATP